MQNIGNYERLVSASCGAPANALLAASAVEIRQHCMATEVTRLIIYYRIKFCFTLPKGTKLSVQ